MRYLRHVCACLALLVLVSSTRGAPQPFPPGEIDLSSYKLTFDENFDRLDVSAWGPGTRWIAHTPWHGDFGDAQFIDPVQTFPFTTEDGILRIEALLGSDSKWYSGLLLSADATGNGFFQQFGYFEMRAKPPPGPSAWPAFWLIANKDEKTSAEIDILEYYGLGQDIYHTTVHVWPKVSGIEKQTYHLLHTVPSGSLSDEFHTYGASVEVDWIVIYLDRKETGRTPAEHKRPTFILLDLALGSGWPIDKTINPSYMYVDYVRAYSKK